MGGQEVVDKMGFLNWRFWRLLWQSVSGGTKVKD